MYKALGDRCSDALRGAFSFALLSFVLALVSCGGGRDNRGNDPCNAGRCQVDVFVQNCEAGTLSVFPDPLNVPAPSNIEWNIATPGYSFTANGIVIQGTGFSLAPGVNGSGKKFAVHDDHTDRRLGIKYDVRVVRDADGVACRVLDPRINNL